MRISGSCHCGNIAFELDWLPDAPTIPARACSCSFCTRHGGVWTSTPAGALRVIVKDPALVSRYAFETRTADFHVCSRCGVVPLVTSRIDDRLYAVVNVNTFEGFDPSRLVRAPLVLDGETPDGRLERRKRNWIGRVEIVAASA
jgi:hypothetical protein